MSALRAYLHRYWFEFGGSPQALPPGGQLGCGVTAVDRADAEHLLVEGPFRGAPLPPVERVVEDVDVGELDTGHIVPNIGDDSARRVVSALVGVGRRRDADATRASLRYSQHDP